MVVKVYISGISGNKEVKKRQQRVLMILDSRNVKYEVIDIAEPENEEAKDFMQSNSTALGATVGDSSPRHPLPPQIFNDDEYCGDYDLFDMANEIDELEKFLKIIPNDSVDQVQMTTTELKLENGKAENEIAPIESNQPVNIAERENLSAKFIENEILKSGEEINGESKLENSNNQTADLEEL